MQAAKVKGNQPVACIKQLVKERNKGGTADIIRPLIAEDGFFIAQTVAKTHRPKQGVRAKTKPSKTHKGEKSTC